MQISDAVEVVEVVGAAGANKKLTEGWTLLAVVPSANAAGKAHVAYVLGKAEEKTRLKVQPQAVANAAKAKGEFHAG